MDLTDILSIMPAPAPKLPPLLVEDLAGRVHIIKRKRPKVRRSGARQVSMFAARKTGPKTERPALEMAIGQPIPDAVWACLLKRRQHCRGSHAITLEAVLVEMRKRGILKDL